MKYKLNPNFVWMKAKHFINHPWFYNLYTHKPAYKSVIF